MNNVMLTYYIGALEGAKSRIIVLVLLEQELTQEYFYCFVLVNLSFSL